MNRAELIGRLGKDPEIRYSQDGKPITSFSVATTYKYKGEETTTWHNIVAFGKLAEICGEYLTKGKQVFLAGRIQNRSYEKNGEKKYISEIIASEMEMLGSKDGEQKSQFSKREDQPF